MKSIEIFAGGRANAFEDLSFERPLHRFAHTFTPIPIDQTHLPFEQPELYVPKDAGQESRYHFLSFGSSYRHLHKNAVLPKGIMPEADLYWYIYQDYPLHDQTEALMRPKRSIKQVLTRTYPSSGLADPEIIAISSVRCSALHTPQNGDHYLVIPDFHAGQFAPKFDTSRSAYNEMRRALGHINWTRLFIDASEQLAIFLNAHMADPLQYVVINHGCNNEIRGPGRKGQFKGERIAQEKGYEHMKDFSYRSVDAIAVDARFQSYLEAQDAVPTV